MHGATMNIHLEFNVPFITLCSLYVCTFPDCCQGSSNSLLQYIHSIHRLL